MTAGGEGGNDMKTDIEALGSDIAKQCGWLRELIMGVFFAALSDANYHTLRSRLEDAYNNYLEEIK